MYYVQYSSVTDRSGVDLRKIVGVVQPRAGRRARNVQSAGLGAEARDWRL
jgi:hypothetical protein